MAIQDIGLELHTLARKNILDTEFHHKNDITFQQGSDGFKIVWEIYFGNA